MPARHPTQIDLFSPVELIKWLPNETLFSLASRHHRLSGHSRAHITCKQLFGHHQRGSEHDFPSRIDELTVRTRGQLGTANKTISNYTILPYYLPFRSNAIAESAYAALRGDGIGHLKYKLGLLTSRFGASHPLKACPQCRVADRKAFHVAYWHLDHQYPGVWICSTHKTLLQMATVKANKVGRFLWFLPDEAGLVDPVIVSANEDRHCDLHDLLTTLAHASVALAQLPHGFTFDVEQLLRVYHEAAGEKGVVSQCGRIKAATLGKEYLRFVRAFRAVPDLSALPGTENEARNQAAKLLKTPRTGTHPVRHLCLILWLFGDWASFWNKYQTTRRLLTDNRLISKDSSVSVLRAGFLKRLREDGCSIRAAACHVGVSVNTGIEWAAQAGLQISRRAKVIKKNVRRKMIADLHSGDEKLAVASKYGVSVQTVSRVLRSERGLADIWREARFRQDRTLMRGQWAELCARNSSSSPKMLRLIEPALYAWLYRHDREWLKGQLSLQPSGARGNYAAAAWYNRDMRLCDEILRALLAFREQNVGVPLSLHDITGRVPGLVGAIPRLNKLPRTRITLERLLTKQWSFVEADDLFSEAKEKTP